MDQVEEIKQRVDIVDLVSSYLELKKTGTNFRALCPFHNEKTPSFMVNQDRGMFKCFGCQESGDIFTFVEKMEGVEFPEAMTKSAPFGQEVPVVVELLDPMLVNRGI